MTAAAAILTYYRANRKAIDAELEGEQFSGLRTYLEIFASYWRGAQHLLRKPESELKPADLSKVRTAAFDVLKEMALCSHLVSQGSATFGLYQLQDNDEPHVRRDFADSVIKNRLQSWYWDARTSMNQGRSVRVEWRGTGVERMLALELRLGQAKTTHAVYFTLPDEAQMLGERLGSVHRLAGEMCEAAHAVTVVPANWPTEEQATDAEAQTARSIADSMFRNLSSAQRAQLRNHEQVVLAALRAASRN